MTIRQRDLTDHRHPSRRSVFTTNGRSSGHSGRPRRSHMAVVQPLLAGLAAAPYAALPGAALAQQNTWTFNYTGTSTQFFTVPSGVNQLYAIVTGGSGGQTNNNVARPGGGGIVTATISVNPGQG
jgi:hypothetical protein